MPAVDPKEAIKKLQEAGFTVFEKKGKIKAYTDEQMIQLSLPITEKELAKHV